MNTREHIFFTKSCNLFGARTVRVCVQVDPLHEQAQSSRLVPQPLPLGVAEFQRAHALREDAFRYDTVHCSMPKPRQQLDQGGLHAEHARPADGLSSHGAPRLISPMAIELER
ncbi:hypothetical protein [Streptomyces sp. NPDC101776]|uniref:hypothetical protein n=1 Tax=Streptomyces sp. NPDC101776 TaxID=3366146 RepID=UPI003815BD1B